MSPTSQQIKLHRSWLNPEMQALHDSRADTWASLHLNPQFASRTAAEQAVNAMYRRSALCEPKRIIWCDSPNALEEMRASVLSEYGLHRNASESYPDVDFGESTSSRLKSIVALCGAMPRASKIWRADFWEEMEAARPVSVANGFPYEESDLPIRTADGDFTVEQVKRDVSSMLGVPEGLFPQAAARIAKIGLKGFTVAAIGLAALLNKILPIYFKTISPWVLPLRDVCVISERPVKVVKDEQGRFHNRSGHAIEYPDGFGLCAINGVFMPEHVVLRPQEISLDEIVLESNTEARRVLIEQFGMPRYLREGDAATISHDDVGILYSVPMGSDDPMLVVRVLNSTPEHDGVMSRDEAIAEFGVAAGPAIRAAEGSRFKEYTLRVPPSVRSAREAVAWTFGLEADDYQPAIET